MKNTHDHHGSPLLNTQKSKIPRKISPRKTDSELINIFWSAPQKSFFGQETIAPVINKSIKTLENDRWRKKGIPYRKVDGRVLYQKCDVINWIESYALVTSTSEYKIGEGHD